MSGWRHVICGACYATRYPGREPVRQLDPTEGRCCFCGLVHAQEIFIRCAPSEAPHPDGCGDTGGAP